MEEHIDSMSFCPYCSKSIPKLVLKEIGDIDMESQSNQYLIRSKTFTQNNPNPKLREKLAKEEDLRTSKSRDDFSATDTINVKKLLEDMNDIRNEVTRQQAFLKTTLTSLKVKLATKLCKMCEKGTASVDSTRNLDNRFVDVLLTESKHKGFVGSKQPAELSDKMCPMCGKIYKSDCIFDEFQEHVESHFIEDTSELNIDHFELVSNALDNF